MSAVADIVLLRQARAEDPYVAAFAAVGWRAVCVPALAFTYPHQAALRARLADAGGYAGLVATSPRAVEALARALDALPAAVRAAWTRRPAYAVGPRTAARLRALGFAPTGADAGTADALAATLAQAHAPPAAASEDANEADAADARPLLFLAGNRRRDALPEGLRAAGVPFAEATVYVTAVRDDLALPPARWVAFFSPSGLDAFQASGGAPEAHRHATLGPTTAAALRDAGLAVHAVADAPTPAALVHAVRTAEGVGR